MRHIKTAQYLKRVLRKRLMVYASMLGLLALVVLALVQSATHKVSSSLVKTDPPTNSGSDFIGVVSGGLWQGSHPKRPSDHAVYSTVLANLVLDAKTGARPDDMLLISKLAIMPRQLNRLAEISSVSKDAKDSLLNANLSNFEFPTSFEVYFDIQWVDGSALSEKCQAKLRESYPTAKGVLELSPIGVSDDFSEALVFLRFTDWNGMVDERVAIVSPSTRENAAKVEFVKL